MQRSQEYDPGIQFYKEVATRAAGPNGLPTMAIRRVYRGSFSEGTASQGADGVEEHFRANHLQRL